MSAFALGTPVRLEDLESVARGGRRLSLPAAARARVARSRAALERAAASGEAHYGVNTGFGELAARRIPPDKIRQLQRNLVLSHSCGMGEPLGTAESRGLVFLRANELARGYSGCRPALVTLLAELVNRGVTPLIPSRGSVGASGDLAPQAHAALVVIGEGRALYRDKLLSGAKALAAARLSPLTLEAKEGLCLINGTQAMQSVGGLALLDALRVAEAADAACALSLEAIMGSDGPLDARIHALKPHSGQRRSAARMRALLAGSVIRESHREGDERVQDPYSFRCAPQVHGAVLEALEGARDVVEVELRSVTDNPLVVGGAVISGGNFHGQPLALAFDRAAAALASLAGVSERRVFQVVSGGGPGLPLFLAKDPGVESGYMIAQYVAAALASELKTLAHPAAADSIPTSANKEDFVSMGMWGALKLRKAVEAAAGVVAVELLSAAQGVEAHRPLKPGRGSAEVLRRLRRHAARSEGDEALSEKLETVRALVLSGAFGGVV
ncbi:MAG: histidine ammonia-lyase [Elusimicrobia bacterium]|nr:histidine ammonia-lyase [Elusimicrobiota bacterium]